MKVTIEKVANGYIVVYAHQEINQITEVFGTSGKAIYAVKQFFNGGGQCL